jgi:hypothetical protein
MKNFEIDANGRVSIDGKRTSFGVAQIANGTIVHKHGLYPFESETSRVIMPQNCYAVSCNKPSSGVPGRDDFFKDLGNIIEKSGK